MSLVTDPSVSPNCRLVILQACSTTSESGHKEREGGRGREREGEVSRSKREGETKD